MSHNRKVTYMFNNQNKLLNKIRRNGIGFVSFCVVQTCCIGFLLYSTYMDLNIIPDIKFLAFVLLLCSAIILGVCWFGIYDDWWVRNED